MEGGDHYHHDPPHLQVQPMLQAEGENPSSPCRLCLLVSIGSTLSLYTKAIVGWCVNSPTYLLCSSASAPPWWPPGSSLWPVPEVSAKD